MIKGILLDSGRVLNEPLMGHWFISPNFFKIINESDFNRLKKSDVHDAFLYALVDIDKHSKVLTLDEEYEYFKDFYTIFLDRLDLNKDNDTSKALAYDLVFNLEKYVFYNDVKPFLDKVKPNYKLGVVSDAWPSLEKVFEHVDLRSRFDSFVISTLHGVSKPDKKIFEIALKELDLKSDEVIFVDDRAKNCAGAEAVGIKSYLLCRDNLTYLFHKFIKRNFTVVKSLDHLSKYL